MKDGPDLGRHDLDLRLAAEASALSGFVDRVEAYAATASLPAAAAARLALVCEEWAANVVEHGAWPGGVAALHLSIRRSDAALHILAEDDGPPFDPLAQAGPDIVAPMASREPGGLGLHLIRHVAREIRYERVGSINRLALVIELGP